MGMFDWTEKSSAVLSQGGVIGPDERLPWPQTAAMGVQHVIAMFGATVLAPILMGFDPNIAILMSGIGTLVFFVITGGKVPSYLGSSFAFIGVVIAAAFCIPAAAYAQACAWTIPARRGSCGVRARHRGPACGAPAAGGDRALLPVARQLNAGSSDASVTDWDIDSVSARVAPPRSCAASSMWRSIPSSRALMVITT